MQIGKVSQPIKLESLFASSKARNLKLILAAFEQLSGLKINFHKSELFCFGDAQNDMTLYTELFGCGQGQFPIRYLGIPIHYRRLTIAEWKTVEERLQKRLSSWKGKLLSLGGRLVLINSVLTNMVLYMLLPPFQSIVPIDFMHGN